MHIPKVQTQARCVAFNVPCELGSKNPPAVARKRPITGCPMFPLVVSSIAFWLLVHCAFLTPKGGNLSITDPLAQTEVTGDLRKGFQEVDLELLGPLQTCARKPEVASRTNKRVSSLRRILRQPSLVAFGERRGVWEVHVVSSKLRKQTPPPFVACWMV